MIEVVSYRQATKEDYERFGGVYEEPEEDSSSFKEFLKENWSLILIGIAMILTIIAIIFSIIPTPYDLSPDGSVRKINQVDTFDVYLASIDGHLESVLPCQHKGKDDYVITLESATFDRTANKYEVIQRYRVYASCLKNLTIVETTMTDRSIHMLDYNHKSYIIKIPLGGYDYSVAGSIRQ